MYGAADSAAAVEEGFTAALAVVEAFAVEEAAWPHGRPEAVAGIIPARR
jgi:hypothetical protein